MVRALRRLILLEPGFVAGMATTAAIVKRALPSRGDAESDDVGLVAIYDGMELASRSRAFRGGSAPAWFGGLDIDLREAVLAPGAQLSVGALAPTLTLTGLAVMGGVAVGRKPLPGAGAGS